MIYMKQTSTGSKLLMQKAYVSQKLRTISSRRKWAAPGLRVGQLSANFKVIISATSRGVGIARGSARRSLRLHVCPPVPFRPARKSWWGWGWWLFPEAWNGCDERIGSGKYRQRGLLDRGYVPRWIRRPSRWSSVRRRHGGLSALEGARLGSMLGARESAGKCARMCTRMGARADAKAGTRS